MKLFIDDIRNAPTEDWIVCRSVTEAIRTIARFGREITEISLDHDISHQVAVGSLSRPYPCTECFCGVAYYIAKEWDGREYSPLKVTMHTSNPVGAKEMQAILKDAGIDSVFIPSSAVNRLESEAKP